MLDIDIQPSTILIEPDVRDTAPAILAAALKIEQTYPDALLLILPSDHVIPDHEAFQDMIAKGREAALSGRIVIFGVVPDRPETGYGYISISGARQDGVQPVRKFIEKPDFATAKVMVEDGNFLWNAGIFLVTASSLVRSFKELAPVTHAAVTASLENAKSDLGFLKLDPEAWAGAESTSIDFAILEKSENISVVAFEGAWSDLGDWEALHKQGNSDDNDVVTFGPSTAIECQNTLLRSEDPDLEVVGLGLNNIVAVAMPDAVLIVDKSRTQDVKQVVAKLRAKGAHQATQHPKDHRPWGWFQSLTIDDRFQVKRIVVKPSAALSLQSHVHRSEHWIVVAGTARVTIGQEIKLLSENQSVYIPLGETHRLENPGKVDLHLIEVQAGAYLGEDDIVRYEDIYARNAED